MNVQDLIDKLLEMPKDLDICIFDKEGSIDLVENCLISKPTCGLPYKKKLFVLITNY